MRISYDIIRNRLKEMTQRKGRWEYNYISSSNEYHGILVIYDSGDGSWSQGFIIGTCSYFDDCGWYMHTKHVKCFGCKDIDTAAQYLLFLFIMCNRTDFIINCFDMKTQRKITNSTDNTILLCFINEGLEVEIEDMDEL